ncbi:hypothetical protein T439DRAFT_327350 [Meredithblackwellia eburnea MCA 4105]
MPPRAVQPAIPTIGDVLRAQYQDPESRAANIGILQGLAVFGGAIVVITQLGEWLVPAF